MRFGKKDYKALVGMDPAVAEVGAAPSSGVGDDAECSVAVHNARPSSHLAEPFLHLL